MYFGTEKHTICTLENRVSIEKKQHNTEKMIFAATPI